MILYTYYFEIFCKVEEDDFFKLLNVLKNCDKPQYHIYEMATYDHYFRFIDINIYFPQFEEYLLTERTI